MERFGNKLMRTVLIRGLTTRPTLNLNHRAQDFYPTISHIGQHQVRRAHYKGFPQDEKGHTYTHPEVSPTPPGPRTVEDFKNPQKNGNWHSYGFDYHNPEVDKYLYHCDTFLYVSLFLITSFWIFLYCPDYRLMDWAKREAYLQLHKRESLGLEFIDKNLVDPARIVLPEDEDIEGIIEIRL